MGAGVTPTQMTTWLDQWKAARRASEQQIGVGTVRRRATGATSTPARGTGDHPRQPPPPPRTSTPPSPHIRCLVHHLYEGE